MRKVIRTEKAAAAVGPYSQAIASQGQIWVSGQVGLKDGRMVEGGVEPEARQALENLTAILEAAGVGPDRVVKATIYLVDMGDFEKVNRIYAEYFRDEPPARACVAVAALPKGARVEIDAVAVS